MAELWKALSTPRRREILRSVWERELSVGEIRRTQPDISLGAVSQHLRVLQRAGLVVLRRDGVQHFYAADREALGPIGSCLEEMWDTALYRLKVRAELEQARRGPRTQRRKRK